MQAPVHSGNAATLHGSGPACDLLVDHSEMAGWSKVVLSSSDGTLEPYWNSAVTDGEII